VLRISTGPERRDTLDSRALAATHAGTSDPGHERARLGTALELAAEELERLATQTSARAGESVGAIFEAQALFARDPGIVDPTLARIDAGVDAADAILDVTEGQAEQLALVDDEYFRERAADVRDVGRRIAAHLRGVAPPDLWRPDGHPAILVADELDPSVVAGLRRELVAGVVLAGGAPTGHAAIVARALGIPLVLGIGAAVDQLRDDDEVAIDGLTGEIIVAPTGGDLADVTRATVATVGDGGPINGMAVLANVASLAEAEAAAEVGASGIGLVRTELTFLGRRRPPTVAEQAATYRRIRLALGDRHVVFRTLDIGGDKPSSWSAGAIEANPALGVRGVRLWGREPAILDDQLRALVESADSGPLRLMLPMVATREELDGVRRRLDAIVASVAADGGRTPSTLDLGVMIEVPSAAIMADALAESAAFFSIGTNDLIQYTLAADRTNPALADLATPLQPALLRLIDGVVRAAHGHGRPVTVCGEAAGDPLVVPLLLGLGVDELSVTPAAIPGLRTRLAELDPVACRGLAERALAARTVDEVRALVE
jgi:phosphoenolpyruvate-protein phosphotransferase